MPAIIDQLSAKPGDTPPAPKRPEGKAPRPAVRTPQEQEAWERALKERIDRLIERKQKDGSL